MVAPKNSIVRKLYESHAHPFMRIVGGEPMSWNASTVATTRPSVVDEVAWSPCNRFIAITWRGARTVDILDPGITNARLGQRLFPFRNRVLRDHQRILSAYLSLGARVGPREFNRTKTVRVIHPPFHSNHPWKTDAVGCGHCDHNTSR